MKATNEQQKTIKEITLKTLEYYIKKQNEINLDLKQIYLDGVSSIKFNDENINVLRLEDGGRLFDYNSNFDYYLDNLNEANVNSVLNSIRKELI